MARPQRHMKSSGFLQRLAVICTLVGSICHVAAQPQTHHKHVQAPRFRVVAEEPALPAQNEGKKKWLFLLKDDSANKATYDALLQKYPRLTAIHTPVERDLASIASHTDRSTPIFVGYFSDTESMRLAQDPAVSFAEPDQPISIAETTASCQTRANQLWNIARLAATSPIPSTDQTGAVTLTAATFPATGGQGVDVVVADTGVDSGVIKSVFGGQSEFMHDVFDEAKTDLNGHGTHVAGIIKAVAPKARILSLKILHNNGSADTADAIRGLAWFYQNYTSQAPALRRPTILNLSVAANRSRVLNQVMAELRAVGIHLVAAAGNSAVDACTVSPASAPEVITVASVTSADRRSGFSNFGPCVDVYAPGEKIHSTMPNSPTTLAAKSGTSQASPHVAGLAALWLGLSPALTPDQLQSIIRSSALDGAVQGNMGNTTSSLAHVDCATMLGTNAAMQLPGLGARNSAKRHSPGILLGLALAVHLAL